MILVLGGTLEGREIACDLAGQGYDILVTVVSGYGAEVIPHHPLLEVLVGPLDTGELKRLLADRGVRVIIDATHPYARLITGIAWSTANTQGIPFIRYERPGISTETGSAGVYRVESYEQAANLAAGLGETIFLTVGSRNLQPFVRAARRMNRRIVARVLPEAEVVEQCLAMGIARSNLIPVQGPFSLEMNQAMFREYKADVMVTKDSGRAGGADTKLAAAAHLGIPVVVITRPDYRGIPVTNNLEDVFRFVAEHAEAKGRREMKTGIIILGHGSKAPQALETLRSYGEMVKAAAGCDIVEVASLQFNHPDLPEALNTVISRGAVRIIIVPLFLYSGVHIQEDIPAVIAAEQAKNPGVEILLANNLGADSRIVEIMLDRIKEVS